MMNSNQLIHDLLYRSVYKIYEDKELDSRAKMKALFHVFTMLLEEATKDEEVNHAEEDDSDRFTAAYCDNLF